MSKQELKGVRSWQDAERVLARFARLERRLTQKKNRASEKIAVIEKRLGEESLPLRNEMAEQKSSLEIFFRRQCKTGSCLKRSRDLSAGRIGLRNFKRLLVPRPGNTLRKLVQHGLADCIRIRQEIDRQALRRLDAATLRSVGARIVNTESFYVGLKETE